jgi:hypothetical protein
VLVVFTNTNLEKEITNMVPKIVQMYEPQAMADNTTVNSDVCNRAGYDHAIIYVWINSDVDINAITLNEHSLVGGTDAEDINTPLAEALTLDAPEIHAFEIDLMGREQYFSVSVEVADGTGGDGAYLAIWAELTKPSIQETVIQKGYDSFEVC